MKLQFNKLVAKRLFLIAVIVLISSCEPFKSSIPDSSVFVERNLSLGEGFVLREIGGFLELTKWEKQTDRLGYGGILIFHAFDDEIYAFDMACPKEADQGVRVYVDTEVPGRAICHKCGRVFNIAYGSGVCIEGTAAEGLRSYRVMHSGTVITVIR